MKATDYEVIEKRAEEAQCVIEYMSEHPLTKEEAMMQIKTLREMAENNLQNQM